MANFAGELAVMVKSKSGPSTDISGIIQASHERMIIGTEEWKARVSKAAREAGLTPDEIEAAWKRAR